MDQKIIRDPVFNYIAIDREKDPWLLDLLNAPEVQRLRFIHQLGLSSFTYPGAEHSRFSHTLGVLHLMQMAADRLLPQAGEPRGDQELTRKALLAGAVVHDVGHAPFSHVLEPFIGKGHEERSSEIVRSEETEVHRVLSAYPGLVDAVGALVRKDAIHQELWKISLLSSQLDVDRMDYLLRDSYFTGAGYGHFDWYRLIHTMQLVPHPTLKKPCIVSPHKTMHALEEYIFSRFYMFEAVYFHKTTRGYEQLLLAVLRRARQLEIGESAGEPMKGFLGPQPSKMPLGNFLRLGEAQVLAQVEGWQWSKDSILSDLCRRFVNRKGLKAIEGIPESGPSALGLIGSSERVRKVRALLQDRKYDPDFYLLEDAGDVTVYQAYHPEKENPAEKPMEAILLQSPQGELLEISRVLERVKVFTDNPSRHVRLYCPDEVKEQVRKILTQ